MANGMLCGLALVCVAVVMAADVTRTVAPPTTKGMAQAAPTTKSPDATLLALQTEVTSLRRENMALAAKVSKLTSRMDRMADEQNATYTVWGSNECRGIGSYKIYSGYAAGPPYGKAAGSSVCLPEVPSWAYHVDGYSGEGGVLGQVQYNIDSGFSEKAFGEDLNHNIMLCAVCHSPRRDILMIPGETTCYQQNSYYLSDGLLMTTQSSNNWDLSEMAFGEDLNHNIMFCAVCHSPRRDILMIPVGYHLLQGWTEEYRGYLMGDASFGGTGAGYMCVDSQPNAVPYNSSFPVYAMGAYLVEVRCGFLPCDDYPDGREVACVVCSR